MRFSGSAKFTDPVPTRAFGWVLALALVLASVANGALPYLKRVGVVEPQTHAALQSHYCGASRGGLECQCAAKPRGEGIEHPFSFVYAPDKPSFGLLKAAKELLFLIFTIVGVLEFRQLRAARPWHLRLIAALGACLVLAFVISICRWGFLFALMGLRGFEFLAMGLLAPWATRHLPTFSRGLVLLLVLEVLLVCLELGQGIPLRPCPESFRAIGTFIFPNALGIAAACILAFSLDFAESISWKLSAGAAAIFLVAASGTATGWLILAMLPVAARSKRLGVIRATLLALAGLGVLVWALPAVLGRPDLYASVFAEGGRLSRLAAFGELASNLLYLFFGNGIGVGANSTFIGLFSGTLGSADARVGEVLPADSMYSLFFAQFGVIGASLFFAMLLVVATRDRRARMTWLAFGIAALTANINESFPVNFLLGLLLARYWVREELQAGAGAG